MCVLLRYCWPATLDPGCCGGAQQPTPVPHPSPPCAAYLQNNELAKVPTAMGHLKGLKEWNLRANRLPMKYEQVGGNGWGALPREGGGMGQVQDSRP